MAKWLDAENQLEIVLRAIQRTAEAYGIRRGFGPRDSLVDSGMTSVAMVNLMLAVEAEFDIMIPDGELTPSNFICGEDIAAMINRILHSLCHSKSVCSI